MSYIITAVVFTYLGINLHYVIQIFKVDKLEEELSLILHDLATLKITSVPEANEKILDLFGV